MFRYRQVGEAFGRPNAEGVDGVLCCGLPKRPGDLGNYWDTGQLQHERTIMREENIRKTRVYIYIYTLYVSIFMHIYIYNVWIGKLGLYLIYSFLY